MRGFLSASPVACLWGRRRFGLLNDEAPTDIALSAATAAEDAALGTVVGALTGTDPEGGSLTFSLTNDASGKFAISGTNLIVSGVLDYETATSHNVTVRATDPGGFTYDEVFAITVTNVAETPPANPLPDDGEVVDDGTFTNPPVVTNVDGAVKISGKKAAGVGAFVYTIPNAPQDNTIYTMLADPDWSLLSNTGKNAFVGFGFIGPAANSAFELAGVRGDGNTGLVAHTIEGANFSNAAGHTLTSEGAAGNGTVGSNLLHQIQISADGSTYTYRTGTGTDPATAVWTDEIVDEPVSDLARFGIGAYFAAGDTGSFSIAITLWLVEEATVTAAQLSLVNGLNINTTLSNDSRTVSRASGAQTAKARTQGGVTTGRYYVEAAVNIANSVSYFGICDSTFAVGTSTTIPGQSTNSAAIETNAGAIKVNNSTVETLTAPTTTRMRMDFDADAETVRFAIAGGAWSAAHDVSAFNDEFFLIAGISIHAGGQAITVYTEEDEWSHAAPTGAVAWPNGRPGLTGVGVIAAGDNTSTIDVPLPTVGGATNAHDILILAVSSDVVASSFSASGFATFAAPLVNGSTMTSQLLWKRAVGGETGNVTVTQSNTGSAGNTFAGTITRWNGCKTSGTPFEALNSAARASASTHTGVTVTPTGDNRLGVAMALFGNDGMVCEDDNGNWTRLHPVSGHQTSVGNDAGHHHFLANVTSAVAFTALQENAMGVSAEGNAYAFALLPRQPTITINPSDKHASLTLSNGNLTVTATSDSWFQARSATSHNTGRKYFEAKFVVIPQYLGITDWHDIMVGLTTGGASLSNHPGAIGIGYGEERKIFAANAEVGTVAAAIAEPSANDVIGFDVDFSANTLKVRNVTDGDAWSIAYSLPAAIDDEATYVSVGLFTSTAQVTMNFGATAFAGTIPVGATSWDGSQSG
jgi:hypothetical protein